MGIAISNWLDKMQTIDSLLNFKTIFYFNSSHPKYLGVKYYLPYDVYALEIIAKKECFSVFEVGGRMEEAIGLTHISGSFFCHNFNFEKYDVPFDIELVSYCPLTDKRYDAKIICCNICKNEYNKFDFLAANVIKWKKV